MTRPILVIIYFLIIILPSWCQDIHYSQYSANPLLVNPAYSGFFDDHMRIGGNYRNQGATISIPYQTYSIFADGIIQPKFLHNDWFGLGGNIYADNAGDGSLQKISVMISPAYHKGFNRFNTLIGSVGFAIGIGNRRIDYTKLVFGNQWNGLQFDPNLPSGENYTQASFMYFDLNTGIMISYKFKGVSNISLGASLSHVTKPYETFYNGSTRMEWKWNLHGNVNWMVNEEWFLESGLLYTYTNKSSEILVGGNVHYGKREVRLCLGLWYRGGSDIIPMAGIDYDRYRLLISCDIPVSEINKASGLQGGFEVTISKTFNFPLKRNPCESFRFY